jgi:hypothetical protein
MIHSSRKLRSTRKNANVRKIILTDPIESIMPSAFGLALERFLSRVLDNLAHMCGMGKWTR